MKRILFNKTLIVASRFVLGIVFIVASIEKIAVPEIFAANIQAYQTMPTVFINLIALIIPWMELICGIFLLGGVFVRSSSLMLSVLLVMFILLIAFAMIRGLKIECGCFGASHGSPVGWMRIIEDIGLLLLGLYLYFASLSGNYIIGANEKFGG